MATGYNFRVISIASILFCVYRCVVVCARARVRASVRVCVCVSVYECVCERLAVLCFTLVCSVAPRTAQCV